MQADSIDLQSPAQLLPAELLAEIFLYCVRNTPSESWLRVDRPPWVFGKVCCRWRAVCLSTPSLWGNLPRLYMNSAQYRDPLVLALLRTSLALSRTVPLSLDLTIFTEVDTCIAQTIPLFHRILPEIQRCRNLVLATNGHSLPLLEKISRNLESLQSLKLRFFGRTTDFDITQSINFFDKAPLLTNASIIIDTSRDNPADNPEHLPFAIRCIPLPWYQLTIFSTKYISDMCLLDVIRNAPLLKECSFTSTWHSSQITTLVNPITHRHLENLSLLFKLHNDALTEVPIHLIEKLSLPSLKHLECTYRDDHTAHLISLVERSGCTLLSLTTYAEDVDDEIISFLGCIPHIRKLELRGVGREALAAMTISPNASTSALIRNLKSVTINLPRCTSRDIQEFIRSRTVNVDLGSVQHLEIVRLCFNSEQRYWEIYHQLEGWSAPTPGDDRAYNALLYQKIALQNLVRELKTDGKSQLLKVC
jgi:hypothetical protein